MGEDKTEKAIRLPKNSRKTGRMGRKDEKAGRKKDRLKHGGAFGNTRRLKTRERA